MERIPGIISNENFINHRKRIDTLEENRRFCRHDMRHFIDVARIAMILNLENGFGFSREWIYAVGLLHDIGRDEQYESGIPHEIASGKIARVILKECGFEEEEIRELEKAILNHRNQAVMEEKSLSGILYRADKLSRACFLCEAEAECNWKNGNKNLELQY